MLNQTSDSSAPEAIHGDPCWIKSSLSFANGDCVEAASLPDGRIGVRDSKDASGPILRFTPAEWRAFLGGARNGEFDHLAACSFPVTVANSQD
jgi:Domain of unknown function (DUF397)